MSDWEWITIDRDKSSSACNLEIKCWYKYRGKTIKIDFLCVEALTERLMDILVKMSNWQIESYSSGIRVSYTKEMFR